MAFSTKNASYQPVAFYEGRRGQVKKIVLLYAGGLDTSTMIPWIKETYKAEIIALTLNLGQLADDLEAVRQRALALGVDKALLIDAREEFARDFIAPSIKANGNYQDHYYLSTPLGRPLLARWAVRIADQEGADAIAHGASGKGNDQVRIDGSVLALNPDLKIIAPAREWQMNHEEQLHYCKAHGVPLGEINERQYVYDDNMWGITTEGGEIQQAELIPPLADILKLCTAPERAPDRPEYLTITFEKGVPVALDDTRHSLSEIIELLNMRAGRHGIGITYSLEDRIIGIKTRGVYEAPAAATIITAHAALERYASTRQQNEFKAIVDQKWAYTCYGALWYEPLMNDLKAYEDHANETVCGQVTLKLYRGKVEAVAVTMSNSVFIDKRATFMENDNPVNVRASAGFIEHYTLQMTLAQRRRPTVLVAVGGRTQKLKLLPQLKALNTLGYKFYATYKTHKLLKSHGIEATLVYKLSSPELKPNVADLLKSSRFDLIISIPSAELRSLKSKEKADNIRLHEEAVMRNTPLLSNATMVREAVERLMKHKRGTK